MKKDKPEWREKAGCKSHEGAGEQKDLIISKFFERHTNRSFRLFINFSKLGENRGGGGEGLREVLGVLARRSVKYAEVIPPCQA